MFTPNKKDIRHKVAMFNLLNLLLKDSYLAKYLMFKGGTYASLCGVLDRFSVDLDFDLVAKEEKAKIRQSLYEIFKKLDLEVKDESESNLQFFLKYSAPAVERNTLKLEINDMPSKYNKYGKTKLLEINAYCNGQTIDTMVANKLFAAKARYDKTGKLAGRDFYDIDHFLKLIEDKVTSRLLNEDLNTLLPSSTLNKKLPFLKDELVFLLKQELQN